MFGFAFILPIVAASILSGPAVRTAPANPVVPLVRTHENRQPAGVLKDGTLVLQLRAGRGLWRPEKDSGPALDIEALGERHGALMAPAPLIRVPEGTTIVVSLQNDLDVALRIHGLCEHSDEPVCAPIEVPASDTRDVRFPSGRAGTYAYWAETTGMPAKLRVGPDSQMSGAFVIDPADASAQAPATVSGALPARATAPHPNDRIFVITEWTDLSREQLRKALAADDPFLAALSAMTQGTTLMNGLSWPDTERLTYRLGETVRWRFVNASAEPHPLHLHGFYFDVDSIGDGLRDERYADGQRKRVVTQLVPPGGTIALTWTPERAGNWLFHCHFMEHVAPSRRLGKPKKNEEPGTHGAAAGSSHAGAAPHADRTTRDGHGDHGDHDGRDDHGGHDDRGGDDGRGGHHGHEGHPLAGMAGMVLGVTVLDAGGTSSSALERAPATPRRLTMTMKSAPNRYGTEPAYGFVLDVAADAEVRAPGPTLVLRRDEPVEITLVNQLPEATAVHWHGMELESYYDGVHGFGGNERQQTPLIGPGESFIVRFAPPRTGTFMYHTHMHDDRQLTAGLYGPMLVIDPGETHDPVTDHTLVIGRDGVGPMPTLVVNGSPKPRLAWRAGTRHRLRFVNITRHDILRVSLATADGPVLWRPLTKDGAPVPPNDARPTRADQVIAVGETYDFEYEAPASRQNLWLELQDIDGRWLLQAVAVVK